MQALSDYVFSSGHFPPLFQCLYKLLKIGIAPTDIKPSNILYNFDSKGVRKPHLVMIDLGFYCFGKTGSEVKILRSNITTYNKLYEALIASDTQESAVSLGRALAVHQLVISMVMMWAKSNGRANRKNFLYVLESQPFSEEIAFQALKDMCKEVIIGATGKDVDYVLNFCLDPIKYQELSLKICDIFS